METSLNRIQHIISSQRSFFSTQATKPYAHRLKQLKQLKSVLVQNEQAIYNALWSDLRKSKEEAFYTEFSIVLQELNHHIAHLKEWMKPERVHTPIHLLPSSSKICSEPLGVVLIVAPWNYPFQLLFNPLIGAISGGNCVVLKPSPDAPETAKLMEKMISETFNEDFVSLVQGSIETNSHLFSQRFDKIFFTGSSRLGKIVMKAAAEHLTPVVLELGGKSPAIVDQSANISLAAKRIIWGKFINAGQTCIAPDYVLVHESVKKDLVIAMIEQIEMMYGKDALNSSFYPRIVSDSAFERLSTFLSNGSILYGGKTKKEDRFISPTIIDQVTDQDPILQEEIFGPILPLLSYTSTEDAINYVNTHEKPLALYAFGNRSFTTKVIATTSSGGACINDTLLHIANHNLPFGGVGNSGMGSYHGKKSYRVFSHNRSILTSSKWFDLPFKYVPFKWFKWVKKMV